MQTAFLATCFELNIISVPCELPVHALGPLSLRLVAGTRQSRLWNEFVARYHYLGYSPMSGSQLRYNVFAGEQFVACLSFGASA